jgi:hypothetical protein
MKIVIWERVRGEGVMTDQFRGTRIVKVVH